MTRLTRVILQRSRVRLKNFTPDREACLPRQTLLTISAHAHATQVLSKCRVTDIACRNLQVTCFPRHLQPSLPDLLECKVQRV